jgi:hypothetical protein
MIAATGTTARTVQVSRGRTTRAADCLLNPDFWTDVDELRALSIGVPNRLACLPSGAAGQPVVTGSLPLRSTPRAHVSCHRAAGDGR